MEPRKIFQERRDIQYYDELRTFRDRHRQAVRHTPDLKLNLKLCDDYSKQNGCENRRCPNLHCCMHYILGNCKFGCKCKNSHNLKNDHNLLILQKNCLEHFTEKEIVATLKIKNQVENMKPLICKGYNLLSGCKFGSDCLSLHLCNHYVTGSCKFGKDCKRSHDLVSKEIKDALHKRNIEPNQTPGLILRDLRTALNLGTQSSSEDEEDDCKMTNKIAPRRSTSAKIGVRLNSACTQEGKKKESDEKLNKSSSYSDQIICTFHLRGKCLYKDSCQKFHQQELLPYQWQYEINGIWVDLPENKNIEKAYCKCIEKILIVHPKYNNIQIHIILNNMAWIASGYTKLWLRYDKNDLSGKLRRLSTESQKEATKGYQYLTLWKWYWKDDGFWSEFKELDGYPSSQKIENAYQSDPSKNLEYDADVKKWKYELNFEKMIQTNTITKRERCICRRPDTFNEDTKKPDSFSKLFGTDSASFQLRFPDYWEKNFKNENLLVELSRMGATANEFSKVEDMFKKTLAVNIKSIKRIQNKELWTFFILKQQAMVNKHPSSGAARLLFHGTRRSYIDAICQQGFDFRLSGTSTGTIWGKGSYFARDAKYSHSYSDSRQIFLAQVLAGDSVLGNSEYRRPPHRPNKKYEMFDSCVDNIADPSIFVIFENNQAYPEYLIEY